MPSGQHPALDAAASARRRAGLILMSAVATFVVIRAVMGASPNSDFTVGGYNVHHLFVGVLLMVTGSVPLIIVRARKRWTDAALILFGCGLALTLDEWVYLIVTDGSNASYLLPVSFWGGLLVVGLACLYVAGVAIVTGSGANRLDSDERRGVSFEATGREPSTTREKQAAHEVGSTDVRTEVKSP